MPLPAPPVDRTPKPFRNHTRRKIPAALPALMLALLTMLALGACTSPQYYAQAVHGQVALMLAQRPVDEVLADRATPPEVRAGLALARDARVFAHAQLGLPDNGSYQSYVELHRPFVVWNVFATPPYSFELRQSCFLVVGCLAYRGYFSEAAAHRHAARLQARGDEVFVGGVTAYSSLGWFADPLLSSMLRWDEVTLVRTLFHELAHQWLYVPGDTAFNESFAMAVAEAGLARWWRMRHPATPLPDDSAHEETFVALILEYRNKLSLVYASTLTEHEKRQRRAEILTALREEFDRRAQDWPEAADYTRWLADGLNNAKLASVATYHTWVPAFRTLLAQANGDLSRFHAAVTELGQLPPAARARALHALMPAPATGPQPGPP